MHLCSCLLHESWSDGQLFTVKHVVTSKAYSKSVIKEMKEKNIFPKFEINLCTACYNHFRRRDTTLDEDGNSLSDCCVESLSTSTMEESMPEVVEASSFRNNDPVDGFCDRVNNDLSDLINHLKTMNEEHLSHVNSSKLEELLEVLGSKFVRKNVAKDIKEIRFKYKDPSYLMNLGSQSFLLERDEFISSFICSIASIKIEDQTNKTFLYCLAVTVEMIYFLQNQNVILPHCFMMNLVQAFVSGSKIVSVVNGKAAPGASYTT
ncbi:uncharacterized protein LOC130636116 [Hydractinia symbiolongicarpus]|uniref:uncharacterized protein LOC130636116 n=1 Tax=Hydractinia symbiolongicarpus TaxID=13093 RepID=UPI00254F671B|nr:uncharacterized protein LOC130636116 [Hydractinia symbiolongicarpus]